MKHPTVILSNNPTSVSNKPKQWLKKLIKLFNEIVSCMAFVLDLEEQTRHFHAWRVAILSTKLAEKNRTGSRDYIFYAGLLHDIGTAGRSEHMVHYPTLAKQMANAAVRGHPYKGAEMVRFLPGLCPSADLIFEHHERYDGRGYPSGIKGNEIQLGSQFLRVADAFDIWLYLCRRHSGNETGDAPSFVEFYKSFSENANRELADDVLFSFLDLLRSDHLYQSILREENLPLLVQETSENLRGIDVHPNIDLVGTTLNLFSEVIDAKHSYTKGHSKRVSEYCLSLALALDLPHKEVTQMKWAALLHDVGKVAIPRKILDKAGSLSKKEWSIVKNHPLFTKEILGMIAPFKNIAEIAGKHQERYDGTGYPDGLKGKKIPQGARILAVADALDAMTSSRPYRPTWTFKEALKEIAKEAGKQFDPEIAKAAILIFSTES